MFTRRYHAQMIPTVVPQLVANDGARALRQAIADPDRFACEPNVDGVRGLVVYQPERVLEMRNRRGEKRDWLRGDEFERGLRRLADRLPNLWEGTILDGELTSGRFEGTMSALLGSKRFRPAFALSSSTCLSCLAQISAACPGRSGATSSSACCGAIQAMHRDAGVSTADAASRPTLATVGR